VLNKTNLWTYGGVGYDHLLVSMPRTFEKYGVRARDLERILADNPPRLVS
jgi:hypothetical protein